MRVIAGQAKGVKLKSPPGNETRPITGMIKEALFNVLGDGVNDSVFLDIFAGSGSVGIEALSRGAREAYFIDKSSHASKIIFENLTKCRFLEKATVFRMDILKGLKLLQKRQYQFDYIYIDPPFDNVNVGIEVMKTLDRLQIFRDLAIIIIRLPIKKEIMLNLENLYHYRADIYGESVLYYYQHGREDEKDGHYSDH